MIPIEWFEQAAQRIAPSLRVTPLRYDPDLDIYLKLENQQITGSFKARGALNRVLTLQPWERQAGIVTASAGNHGQGVALATREVGAHAVIFASDHAVQAKVDAMRALGADVRLVPGGYGEAEQAGLAYVRSHEGTWISPYNDPQVVAGQGTIGLELDQQLPPDFQGPVLVPVGGGGLISGIGIALRGRGRQLPLIGLQAHASPFFQALYERGSQAGVQDLPTLADGLSGAIEPDSLTIPLVRNLVEQFILVEEEEIAHAIAYAWYHYSLVIEGSAAVSLAAVLGGKVTTRPAALIFSGGNIQPEEHARLIDLYHAEFQEGAG